MILKQQNGSVNSRVVCIFILSTEYSKCLDQLSLTSKSLGFLKPQVVFQKTREYYKLSLQRI